MRVRWGGKKVCVGYGWGGVGCKVSVWSRLGIVEV